MVIKFYILQKVEIAENCRYRVNFYWADKSRLQISVIDLQISLIDLQILVIDLQISVIAMDSEEGSKKPLSLHLQISVSGIAVFTDSL